MSKMGECHAVLLDQATCREKALDSVAVASVTGFAVPSVSCFLHNLWRKGLVLRIEHRRRRDANGRGRLTYAYYSNPDGPPQTERIYRERRDGPAFDATALGSVW